METYSFVLSITIITSIVSQLIKNKSLNNILFFISFSLIASIIIFRDKSIGVDTIAYYDYFKNPAAGYWFGEQVKEPLYRWYQLGFKSIWDNAYAYISITSFITLLPIIYLFKNYSLNKSLSSFLFFTVGTTALCLLIYLAAVRQCLMLSLLLWSILLYNENGFKINKTLVLLLICSFLIHFSAIVYLPIIYFASKEYTKKKLLMGIIASLILGIFIMNFFPFIQSVALYFNKGYYANLMQDNNWSIGVILPYSFFCIALISLKKEICFFDKLMIFGTMLNNLFSTMGDSIRLFLPFLIISCVCLANLVNDKYINKAYRIVLFFIIISYFSDKFFKVLYNESSFLVFYPYKSFLF